MRKLKTRRMRKFLPLAAISLATLFNSPAAKAADDGSGDIFPALPAARDAVNWKNGYFWINGKPTLIRSGSIHYARVPRELWRDRIWRLKMMGFNCVQSYVFWNASEPREGVWDFTDNNDLDAWLSLLKEMGMYALVRVGPYSCAEWEEGGYPAWLSIKPGMIQREMGPVVPYVDAHLKKIEEITARHQVNRGGCVFMVQLENEHSRGWGTDVSDPFLKHLDDEARANGIEVPMFNSGLHHSSDPSGEVPFTPGASPWYSTEFWTGWIGKYGEMAPGALSEKIRGTWKILAFGGAGYNYYMAHGGTNFGYSGSGEPPGVSYDYSAPVGEAGQLRTLYYAARRAAWFANSFTPLLAGSHNDPGFAKCDQPSARVTTRTNPTGGSIVFVDHFQRKGGAGPVAAILPDAGAYHPPKADANGILDTRLEVSGVTLTHPGMLRVATLEPSTVIINLPWTASATFQTIWTNVLLRQSIGGVDYWVCYGRAGESGEVTVRRVPENKSPFIYKFTYPTGDAVTELSIPSGDGQEAKFLVMNTEMTNRTWFAHDKLYVGASFAREDGRVEFPPEGGRAAIYTASGKQEIVQNGIAAPSLPALTSWTWRDGAAQGAADYATAGWLQSEGPRPMETYDGYQNLYGWYRTTLHCDSAGPVYLHFGGGSGTVTPFLNGSQEAAESFRDGQPGTLEIANAKAGDNALALLVKAPPRPKTTYHGAVGKKNARGLWGGVSNEKAAQMLSVSWKKWEKPPRDVDVKALAQPSYDDSTWSALPADAMKVSATRGDSWYRGSFTITAGQVDSMLESPEFRHPKPGQAKTSMTGGMALYLNGQLVEERVEDVSRILVPGKNEILLNIQSRLGDDTGELAIGLWHNSASSKTPWFFHAGLDSIQETAIIGRALNWEGFLTGKPWQTGDPATKGRPTFWRCTFAAPRSAGARAPIGLNTTGLKAGQAWLNGHNLGDTPQGYPMYMPECWIKESGNDLVIFDLYGNKPDQVTARQYEAFSIAQAAQPTP